MSSASTVDAPTVSVSKSVSDPVSLSSTLVLSVSDAPCVVR